MNDTSRERAGAVARPASRRSRPSSPSSCSSSAHGDQPHAGRRELSVAWARRPSPRPPAHARKAGCHVHQPDRGAEPPSTSDGARSAPTTSVYEWHCRDTVSGVGVTPHTRWITSDADLRLLHLRVRSEGTGLSRAPGPARSSRRSAPAPTRTQRMPVTRHERGFSLVELMVAMTVTLIVSGAIYGLLTSGEDRLPAASRELADGQHPHGHGPHLAGRVQARGRGCRPSPRVHPHRTLAGGACAVGLNGSVASPARWARAGARGAGDVEEHGRPRQIVSTDERCPPLTECCITVDCATTARPKSPATS